MTLRLRSGSAPEVHFTFLKSTTVPPLTVSKQDYQALAAFVLGRQRVKGPVELTVDITGHERIQELNRRFRGVDRTTDVISFRNAPPPALEGDLAINVLQATIQAKKMRHSTRREMRLLLIHGILHLLGYTDYESRPRRRMFKRQNALLLSWERMHP
jgi:probable rRNA maturation factor